jgi:hypothetical protein
MIRPSQKELFQKIRAAKKTVSTGRIMMIDQLSIIADAIGLGYIVEDELIEVLGRLLEVTTPRHYVGTAPPQKSYKAQIRGLELFAFAVESDRFKCRVYYKFALVENIFWLISLHRNRKRRGGL